MITYIQNFKSLKKLEKKKDKIIINIFKLVDNANITIVKKYIDYEWTLTILVR